MGKVGRNDPCPCGSGKKYKKCCLEKDEQAARRVSVADDESRPDDDAVADDDFGAGLDFLDAGLRKMARKQEKRMSKEQKRWKRFWDELGEASPDEKIRMALSVIENEPRFDGELAFMLVDAILAPLQKAGRAADLDEIIRRIEELQPEAYADESGWLNYFRAGNAMLQPDGDLLTPVLAMAREPDKGIDEFFRIIYRLQYHDRTDVLRRVLPEAWSHIKDSSEIMSFGIHEFKDMCLCLVLDKHLEDDPDLDPDDPAFLGDIRPYYEGDRERLKKIVLHSSGREKQRLEAVAFEDPEVEQREYIFFLSLDFNYLLHQNSRARLAQDQIREYLIWRERQDDERKAKPGPGPLPQLLPDPKSVDRFLAGHLNSLGSRPYQAAAFCQAIPPWLEFLASRGLANPAGTERLWSGIRKKLKPLPKALEWHVYDPVMLAEVKALL